MKRMRYFSRKIKKKKGFTLLELMIAAGILIVALSGLLATYITCLELNEATKNSNLALNALQEVLEEIRNIAFPSIFGLYNGYSFEVSGMPANASCGYVFINNSNPDLLELNIGVCWRQKNSKIIGECQDVSGVVTFSDSNGNSMLDSPIELTTLMAQR